MTIRRFLSTCLLLPVGASLAGGQAASKPIPIRTLTAAASTDSGVVAGVYGIRALSTGRVLVNDYTLRRIVMFDSTMTKFTTVADTAAGAANNYGANNFSGLLPWLGDSTLFADRSAQALIVIEPDGKFGRVMSPPKLSDFNAITNAMVTGAAGVDPQGRIYYRSSRRPPPSAGGRGVAMAPPVPPTPGVPRISAAGPDSAPIMRGDFDARSADTVMMIGIQPTKSAMISMPSSTGGMSGFGTSVFNPLPKADEWALMPDGTVAVVRGHDYHVDWLLSDGKVRATPKMPFDWRPITHDDKVRIIDSVKTARAEAEAKRPGSASPVFTLADGTKFAMPFLAVEPDELPDYYPPVRQGQVKADIEGNLWVLPSTSSAAAGGLLFDIVNRDGEVFERVQLPAGRSLLGFGHQGVVFMSVGVSPNTRIERATVIRGAAPAIKQ